MQYEDETTHNEVDEVLLTEMAWASGLALRFGPFGAPVTDFWRCVGHFIADLRAQWSTEKASVQFLGYNDTSGFSLFAFSDDEETMNIVIDDMPEMLRLIIGDMGVTIYFFCVTGEVPGHPEVLMVGGATIGGEHAMGWLEITRDNAGNERLGRWNSFTVADEVYLQFASSWMMRLLETRANVH